MMVHDVPLLEVDGLEVQFKTQTGVARVVRGLSYAIRPGETLGLVGESGAGKSIGALALVGLLPRNSRVEGGSVRYKTRELLGLGENQLRAIRGKEIGFIFQDPFSNLNPVMRVGRQIQESLEFTLSMSKRAAAARTRDLLGLVGIPDPANRVNDYPHQFSGGMCQRVMIAMALSCEPDLLIADEPATALDVTTQAQILELLRTLQAELGMAILLITHNLGVVAGLAERVAVMYAGRIVETAGTERLLSSPAHPYTLGLLKSVPRLDSDRRVNLIAIDGSPPNPSELPPGCPFLPRCSYALADCARKEPDLLPRDRAPSHEVACIGDITCEIPQEPPRKGRRSVAREQREVPVSLVVQPYPTLASPSSSAAAAFLEVRDLHVWFPLKSSFGKRDAWIRAVDGVTLSIARGTTLGLVGESGSGKTTIGRAIVQIERPQSGSVLLDGQDLGALRGKELRHWRRRFQMVFQNPFASLNPRHLVEDIVAEPLAIHDIGNETARRHRVGDLLELVGLDATAATGSPREFSGGQRQRISIARAIAASPELIVCDEPVSSLDVSIQAQIINLLRRLQREFALTYLFVAHDLAVVRHVADEIAVMYLGTIVEQASSEELYEKPLHPYTAALISAIPIPDVSTERTRTRILLPGDIQTAVTLPEGCRFQPRCWLFQALDRPDICISTPPVLRAAKSTHTVACHFAEEVKAHLENRRPDTLGPDGLTPANTLQDATGPVATELA